MKSDKKWFRKLWMGEVYFSLNLNNLGRTWELCKLVRKAKEGKKINRARIKIKEISLGLRKPLYLTTKEVACKFKEAKDQYLNLRPNARDMFQAFLLDIADRPIVEMKEEAIKEIQRIFQSEEVPRGWIFIGQVLGEKMNIIVMKVTATAGGSLAGKLNKEDIEKSIIEVFCSRFNSRNCTPIRSPYMAR